MSRRGLALAFLLTLAWSSPLYARSAEAGHGPDWGMLLLQIFNTAVLVFLLLRFALPALRNFLFERSRGIRRDIEAAEGRLRDAESEIDQLRNRLEHFEQEAAEINERSAAMQASTCSMARGKIPRPASRSASDARVIPETGRASLSPR